MEKNQYLKPEISVLLLQTENVLQALKGSPQTVLEDAVDEGTHAGQSEELY